jgi:hypothetical protein
MTFDEALGAVRALLGREIAVNLTDPILGPGTGYIADFSGRLGDIYEPIPEVDQDVHYCKVGDGAGFALPRAEFQAADWREIAGTPSPPPAHRTRQRRRVGQARLPPQ